MRYILNRGGSGKGNLVYLLLLDRAAWRAAVTIFVVLMGGMDRVAAGGSEPTQPKGMTVTVARSAHRCFPDQVKLSASLVPSAEMLVRPDTEGFLISEILVEKGQQVLQGQVLAKLVRAGDARAPAPGMNLTSPGAGVVSFKAASVGGLASARGEPLFRIAVGGAFDAEAEAPVLMHQKISPGQEARVTLAGGEEVVGRVKEKSFSVDPVTQLGRVRVSMPRLVATQAGAFAKIVIFAGESCGMTVPLSAILYGPGGSFLQVVSDGKIETRRVRVGFLSENNAQIREGVGENDIIVAKAGAFLREGDTVTPVLIGGYVGKNVGLARR